MLTIIINAMRCIIIISILAAGTCLSAIAGDVTIYPTIPGTNIRDYSQPGVRIEDNNAYPTIPGTHIRDYSRPGARIEGNNVYPTIPGTNFRDYSRPGLKIESDED